MISVRLRRVLLFALMSTLFLSVNLRPTYAQPGFQDDLEGFRLIASSDLAFSVYAPDDWPFQSIPANEVYASTLLVAENDALMRDLVAYQLSSPASGTASGAFAIVTRLAPQFWQTLAPNAEQAGLTLLQLIAANSPVYDEFVIEIGADGYTATVIETVAPELNAQGYIAAFVHANELYVLQLMATPPDEFSDDFDTLDLIGSNISVPAAAGALTDPEQAQPTAVPTEEVVVTPEVLPTDEAEPAMDELTLFTAEGGVLSVELPESWVVQDRTEESSLIGFGDTVEATDARLYAFVPDAFEARTAMTGTGGVIALYDAAAVGITPDNPDVGPLMTQVIGTLEQQGYQIIDDDIAFGPENARGKVITIHGEETGYLALIPFGDQVAYVTTTGAGGASDEQYITFIRIIGSVRVPAAEPAPAATPMPGLGGLGSLQTGEATATPQAGLGGLGGLGGAATQETEVIDEEATAEAS